ncbi:hypothetical protein KIH86_06610 [Paenibacillus sp. HN-1]|uniref:hypothetical protein n=1 Tax=Paenibacillus TaxID=44249 RepID=UPI001CA91FF8|nr:MULTISPECIES: hypothetical protein [Paenibacillus]MBY9077988.1 hypothetical protein [Paenibacillus sp. CGMCC 1.18879]MBY9083908.1 hypothetical protein [Paenibacillus sinensis]
MTQKMDGRILLAFERANRFEGTGVSSVAFHPGWIKSRLTRHAPWRLRVMALYGYYCIFFVFAASAKEIEEMNIFFIPFLYKIIDKISLKGC